MRGFIANTDHDWVTQMRAIEPAVDEVNFWRPGAEAFRALQSGEPFFFKLKAPRNAIAGFATFAHFSLLPVSMAWQVYGSANGVATFGEMRQRVAQIRKRLDMETEPKRDYVIGCILLNQPVFFEEAQWVRVPDDWDANIGQGQTYELDSGEGQRVWLDCLSRVSGWRHGEHVLQDGALFRPRLGALGFQVAVLDAYDRRCAVTGEGALPALQAAHIRDVADHSISNGLLLRSDLARLFEAGYVTVTPELRFVAPSFSALDGLPVRVPEQAGHRPDGEALWWHGEERFLG